MIRISLTLAWGRWYRAARLNQSMSRHRILSLAVLAAGVPGLLGVAEAVTPAEIAKARSQRAAIQRELDQAVRAYEEAASRLTLTQQAAAQAQLGLTRAEAELRNVQAVLSKRASITYRHGTVGFLSVLLEAEGFAEFSRRIVLIEKAAGSDAATLLRAARIRGDIAERQDDLLRRRAEEQAIVKRLRALTTDLSQRFEVARRLEARLLSERDAELRRRREAAARAARAAALARRSSFNPGQFHCPMDGPNSFRDTWGDPRSGGRRHLGVDIYAAYGTPVAAVVDGTILRMMRSSLGGITLYLRGGDATEYFYAHLAGYAGISPGQRVAAGSHIAYNGNSGNARGGPPHLHFEIHPGGGAAINPYPTVRAACG